MQSIFLKVLLPLFLLFSTLPAYSAEQKPASVLVRQAPVIKGSPYDKHDKPAPGKAKGFAIHKFELGSGNASWKYEVDHGGEEKVVDLNATFTFDPPPAEITPGETIELNISGTLSGHSYGYSLRPALSYKAHANFGVNFQNGGIGLYNGELPLLKKSTAMVISNAKHGGNINKKTTATLAVSKSAGDSFHITAYHANASITWPYKLMAKSAQAEVTNSEDAKDCLDLRRELKKDIDALKQKQAEYDKWQQTFNQFYEDSKVEMCAVFDDLSWKIDSPLPFVDGIEISKPATVTGGVRHMPQVRLTGATSRRATALKHLGELDKLAGLVGSDTGGKVIQKFTSIFTKLTDKKMDYYEGLERHKEFMESRRSMLGNYSHILSRYYCDNVLALQEKVYAIKETGIDASNCGFNEKQVLISDITRGTDIRNITHLETARRYCRSL